MSRSRFSAFESALLKCLECGLFVKWQLSFFLGLHLYKINTGQPHVCTMFILMNVYFVMGGVRMDVLLIIVVIGAILLGYVAVSRLDRFYDRGGFTKEPDAVTKEIFLYGAQEIVEALSKDLNKAKITNDWATEPEMNAGINYHWIGAFSDNDEDNLLACLSAMRNQSGIHTMAKCNDMTYQNVFKQTKIMIILRGDATAAQIIIYLKGSKRQK
mgnify:CR=1 FL=1